MEIKEENVIVFAELVDIVAEKDIQDVQTTLMPLHTKDIIRVSLAQVKELLQVKYHVAQGKMTHGVDMTSFVRILVYISSNNPLKSYLHFRFFA